MRREDFRVALDKAQEETKFAVRRQRKLIKKLAEAKKRAFAARKETERPDSPQSRKWQRRTEQAAGQ